MSKKSGQARVLTHEQKAYLFAQIAQHRHPEKNAAIMQVSFCLGLRVQEIALLELKEVCTLGPKRKTLPRTHKVKEILKLPASYTKGANATNNGVSAREYKRTSLTFSTKSFANVLRQVEKLAKAGGTIDPELYYPDKQNRSGTSRDLPMVHTDLRNALDAYLEVRLSKDFDADPSDRLFLSQKGTSYSPNSLQNHMGKMLKTWAMVEGASSHSGRRTVLTEIIHDKGYSVKLAQQVAGHKDPATTIKYEDLPEKQLAQALKKTD